jgi:hypothetical protein
MIGVERVVNSNSTNAATGFGRLNTATVSGQDDKEEVDVGFFDLRVRRKPGNAMAAMVEWGRATERWDVETVDGVACWEVVAKGTVR